MGFRRSVSVAPHPLLLIDYRRPDKWAGIHHHECYNCGVGGELICCDFCNCVFHPKCCKPAMDKARAGREEPARNL